MSFHLEFHNFEHFDHFIQSICTLFDIYLVFVIYFGTMKLSNNPGVSLYPHCLELVGFRDGFGRIKLK